MPVDLPTNAPSMRWRIASVTAVLVLFSILALCAALLIAVHAREDEFIDLIVAEQMEHSQQRWKVSPALASPNTPDMQLFHVAPGAAPDGVPDFLATLPRGDHELRHDGKEFHVAVRETTEGRFILAYDVEEHGERERSLWLIVLSGALMVSALTLASIYRLAGRLTRHLDRLAAGVAAGTGVAHNHPGMERELLILARALATHEARQAEQLAREREFSANLSHELRTPLASIRSDAEMLAELPAMPEAATRRAARISATVGRITALAESLLALAREGAGETREDVPLAAALRETCDALLPARSRASEDATDVCIDVPDTAMVAADPSLLRLVLRNLLDNALRHARAGEVTCTLDGSILQVRDSGPGFAADELPFVFERQFHGGGNGRHGIGLALVRHVAAASGWRAAAGNADEGGATVSVDFGESLHFRSVDRS